MEARKQWADKEYVSCVYVHTHITHRMEYYSGIEKNEIIQFVATWMNLEIIILIDVSQRQTDVIYHLLLESKKKGHKWIHSEQK